MSEKSPMPPPKPPDRLSGLLGKLQLHGGFQNPDVEVIPTAGKHRGNLVRNFTPVPDSPKRGEEKSKPAWKRTDENFNDADRIQFNEALENVQQTCAKLSLTQPSAEQVTDYYNAVKNNLDIFQKALHQSPTKGRSHVYDGFVFGEMNRVLSHPFAGYYARHLALGFLYENRVYIDRAAGEEDNQFQALRAASLLTRQKNNILIGDRRNPDQVNEGHKILEKHMSKVLKGCNDNVDHRKQEYQNIWEYSLTYASPEQKKKLASAGRSYITNLMHSNKEDADKAVSLLNFLETPESEKVAVDALDGYFSKEYSVKFSTMYKVWKNTAYKYDKDKPASTEVAVKYNLLSAMLLEQEAKGAVALLHKKFGISCFARYPKEVLLKQVAEIDADKPYGVVMYPHADHNGALYHNLEVFRSLVEQLGNDYALRIVEAGSKFGTAHRLFSLDKRYGDTNKISFALLGGHGAKDHIQFGKDKQDEPFYLKTEDLSGRTTSKSGQFFAPYPTIILVSCGTGVKDGIGEEMANRIGATVKGPRTETNIKAIQVVKENGRIHLYVIYYKDDQETYIGTKDAMKQYPSPQ